METLWETVATQGIFAAMFVFLFIDTRKDSKERERTMMANHKDREKDLMANQKELQMCMKEMATALGAEDKVVDTLTEFRAENKAAHDRTELKMGTLCALIRREVKEGYESN